MKVTLDANIWVSAFNFSGAAQRVLDMAERGDIEVAISEAIIEITEDPDDDRILECAVASGSNVILSRDKDLLRRETYEGIRIVTMAEFFAWRREM